MKAIDMNYRVSGEIERQLNQLLTQIEKHLSQLPTQAAVQELDEGLTTAEATAQAPLVRAIDLLIRQAARDRASDIHIEPQEDRLRIRFRIDGILHDVISLPLSVHPAMLSRIKIMAGFNIAERRRPQDGQITIKEGERKLDIRVATSNTIYGEMAILQIKPHGGTESEVEGLLKSAEQQFPGITDLLKVYGGYEEMIREVQQYVEATRQEPLITTSNRSDLQWRRA